MSDANLDHAAATAPLAPRFPELLATLPPVLADHVETLRFVRLEATRATWTATGISLREGQWISLLANGRVYWSPSGNELWAGPRHHMWGRVGDESVWNPSQDTTTRQATCDGELELSLLHGFWKDAGGELASSSRAYERLRGGIEVIVIAWRGEPLPGLDALAEWSGDPLVRREGDRMRAPVALPPDWSYLLDTGSSDLYRASTTPHGPGIALDASNDQGILRKMIDWPLDDTSRLHWRWRLDELPSERGEDRAVTHDYISIATEFDDGRDLTWFWSGGLKPETHFHCPIKAWNWREIHYCIRSGASGLGEWQEESRPILADCRTAIDSRPHRVVAVWLIVVSSFQHGRARGEFSDIWLSSGDDRIRVL